MERRLCKVSAVRHSVPYNLIISLHGGRQLYSDLSVPFVTRVSVDTSWYVHTCKEKPCGSRCDWKYKRTPILFIEPHRVKIANFRPLLPLPLFLCALLLLCLAFAMALTPMRVYMLQLRHYPLARVNRRLNVFYGTTMWSILRFDWHSIEKSDVDGLVVADPPPPHTANPNSKYSAHNCILVNSYANRY